MKLWQLFSITRNYDSVIYDVALTKKSWDAYASLAQRFSMLVEKQERTTLDSMVDTDFVLSVLSKVEIELFLSFDGWLRTWRMHDADTIVSFADVYSRFGADALEEVIEKGSVATA